METLVASILFLLLQLFCYSKYLGIAMISVSGKGLLEQWNEKAGQGLWPLSVARIRYTVASPIPSGRVILVGVAPSAPRFKPPCRCSAAMGFLPLYYMFRPACFA